MKLLNCSKNAACHIKQAAVLQSSLPAFQDNIFHIVYYPYTETMHFLKSPK